LVYFDNNFILKIVTFTE